MIYIAWKGKERKEIINLVKNDKIEYYYKGNAKLKKYRYVSQDGEIYVHRNNKDEQVICFWIFRGVMSGSVELVYSSKGKKLIEENIDFISKI